MSPIEMENTSWAGAIPPAQGLYNPELEKDACGVGFMVHVKGVRSHKILSEASSILCNMTHRGASGADIRDGDGAGKFFVVVAVINDILKKKGVTYRCHVRYSSSIFRQ